MAHVQFIVDGTPIFDDDIPEFTPPTPAALTDQMRAETNPHAKLAPWRKQLAIAMLAKNFERVLADPRLAPLNVRIKTRPTGFTLAADAPPLGPDDLKVTE